MSNIGQVTKTFIASGQYSQRALINFTNDWNHSFVETVFIPHELSEDGSAVKADSPKFANSITLMIIDNEASAIKRAIEYISHVNQICSELEITVIQLVDQVDSTIDEELLNLHEEIKEVTSAHFMQVNQCTPIIIESLVAMYAHLYCGWSPNCIDIEDLANTLKSGYYFEASRVATTTAFELPFAAYQAAENISCVANQFSEIESLAFVIVSNEGYISFSLEPVLWACADLLAGFANKDIYITYHANIHPNNTNYIHLGAVFKKLPVKEQLNRTGSNDITLDTPDFLRKN